MNRVAHAVLAGLVLFLVLLSDVPLARADAVCSAAGEPSVACDASSNCFRHCCLSSGVCPAFSCTASLDAPDNAGANCDDKCLAEVQCNPFNPGCPDSPDNEVCIGTISCKTANCDGRLAGSACLIQPGRGHSDDAREAVKICENLE
jgi:hypothetical protein